MRKPKISLPEPYYTYVTGGLFGDFWILPRLVLNWQKVRMGQIPSGIVHVFCNRSAVIAIKCSWCCPSPTSPRTSLLYLVFLIRGEVGRRGVGGLDVTGSSGIRDLDTWRLWVKPSVFHFLSPSLKASFSVSFWITQKSLIFTLICVNINQRHFWPSHFFFFFVQRMFFDYIILPIFPAIILVL